VLDHLDGAEPVERTVDEEDLDRVFISAAGPHRRC
jgi:hypothetical protein